jgi:hypothetical protein
VITSVRTSPFTNLLDFTWRHARGGRARCRRGLRCRESRCLAFVLNDRANTETSAISAYSPALGDMHGRSYDLRDDGDAVPTFC